MTRARQAGEKKSVGSAADKPPVEKREGEGSSARVSVATPRPRVVTARTHGRVLHETRARQAGDNEGASAGSGKPPVEKREDEGSGARVSAAPARPHIAPARTDMRVTRAQKAGGKKRASAGSSKESAEKREGEGSGASVSVAAARPRMAIARTHGRLHGTRAW